MAEIKTVCVFCGSSPGRDGQFIDDAKAFGTLLGTEKIGLVFGRGGRSQPSRVGRPAIRSRAAPALPYRTQSKPSDR
jgi:hypothetical protein